MPNPLVLTLDAAQMKELTEMRDHHPLPYMREKAAALLRIASGWSANRVALEGLWKPRTVDTICSWYQRYRQEGTKGLLVKPGRGRKAAFSPSVPRRRQRTGSHAAFSQA